MTDLMHADHLVSRCPHCGAWQWNDFCNTCWPRLRLDDDKESAA